VDNTENSVSLSRAHLIYALALPLAALIGFLLAEPLGSNLFIVFCLVGALALPLLMRWYHFLLLATWNASLVAVVLPGSPPWWMLLTAVGLFIVVLNRCVGSKEPFLGDRAVPIALLILGVVVFGTAMLTGGAGIRVLGGESFGGRRYVFIAAAIMGYFVLASRSIPPHRAWVYLTVFLLAGFTSTLSDLAGRGLGFLGYIVPTNPHLLVGPSGFTINRVSGLGVVSSCLFLLMLARYGAKGVLDLTCWWRLMALLAIMAVGLLSGYRSHLLGQILTFAVLFFVEGLHRSRYLLVVAMVGLLAGAALPFVSSKMPFSMQRSLSFLPIPINPLVHSDAKGSVDWRTEMWRQALPKVKEHLWLGEGLAISPDDLYMSSVNVSVGYGIQAEASSTAGDYHSGPLSVMIPFGVWGLLAFLWLGFVGIRFLRRQIALGPPQFQTINRLLFASFAANMVFFFAVFGDLTTNLAQMVGVLGFAASLNGGAAQQQAIVAEDGDDPVSDHG
jgi:hypothetical protein